MLEINVVQSPIFVCGKVIKLSLNNLRPHFSGYLHCSVIAERVEYNDLLGPRDTVDTFYDVPFLILRRNQDRYTDTGGFSHKVSYRCSFKGSRSHLLLLTASRDCIPDSKSSIVLPFRRWNP